MDIIWKGILGGLLTALIAFLSKRGNTLPGILPLFPTFAIIALAIATGVAAWLVVILISFYGLRAIA